MMVRGLLTSHMTPLAKKPKGVQPVATGEAWRHCISKCALTVGSADAKAACSSNQLYMGLAAGTNTVIITVLARMEMYDGMIFSKENIDDNILAMMAEEGVLQTPVTGQAEHEEQAATATRAAEVPFAQEWQTAGEGANSGSKMVVLWTVRHLWLCMSRFALN